MEEQDYLAEPMAYDAERLKLARRRKIAEALIRTEAPGMVGTSGITAMSGPLGGVGAALSRGAGQYDLNRLDEQDKLLGQQEVGQNRRLLQAQGLDPDLAQAAPGIRSLIEKQLALKSAQEERGAQLAADREWKTQEAEANRIERGEQQAADRVAREDLRKLPTQHISITNTGGGQGKAPAGYRWTEDGNLAPITGGPADPAVKGDKPLTDAQAKDVVYGTRAAQAQNVLDSVGINYTPMKLDIARGAEKVPGGRALANTALLGEGEQMVDQAQRNFINAVLRRESGAVISPDEFSNARKQYFPEPGDGELVLKQKKANRELVISGLATGAGKVGAKDVEKEQANKQEPYVPKPKVKRKVWGGSVHGRFSF